jgi:hypothetical protein
MNNKIKFVKSTDEMLYNPEKRLDTFYQFCQFKNPYSGMYGSRKIIFDEKGNTLKIYEKEYSSEKIEAFVKHHRSNKYKMYPVKEIAHVGLPNECDMIESKSELLNNDIKTYDHQCVDFD